MDDTLNSLLRAVKTVQKAAEKVAHYGPESEQISMIVGQYTRLHTKVREQLPEDTYIAALAVDPIEADGAAALNRVNFAVSQLGHYLQGLQEDF